MLDSTLFSIIIPTKDRPQDLENCIASIANQSVLPKEMIVVDASSEDICLANKNNCANIVQNKSKLLHIPSCPGVNIQRNTGAAMASGEVIMFIDDDVVLEKDYCEKILEVYGLYNHTNIGGVSGAMRNYYNSGLINRAFKKLFFMTRVTLHEGGRFLPSLGYVYVLSPKEIIEVQVMQSGFCSYYRDIFNKYKFDKSFDRCTDLDISYRVSRKYKLFQTPYAQLTHYHSESTHLNIRKLNERLCINEYNLVNKHLPRKFRYRAAYYISVVGELILASVKSLVKFSPDPLLGRLDGLKVILENR